MSKLQFELTDANVEKFAQKICTTFLLKNEAEVKQALALLLTQCEKQDVTMPEQVAYVLATVYHECRFRSIREIRAKAGTAVFKMQEKYWASGYYGRGYSQLTWEGNYRKFSAVVGIDLVKYPDEALRPEIGAHILVHGMRTGLFSGMSLGRCFVAGKEPQWRRARSIVNGFFQWQKVADAAKKILVLYLQPNE